MQISRLVPAGLALGASLWLLTLAGCATPYTQGVMAARQGRYAEASVLYEQALAKDPDRLDALVQLGLARYKLGDLDGAVDALERARPRAPGDMAVRLFLGIAYLRKNELGRADEHLTAFVDLKPDRRLAAQAERTITLIRMEPLSEQWRTFAAASLETEAELAQEAIDAWRALQNERWYYGYPYPWYPYPAAYPAPLCVWRAGWLRCY
jgi:tetratricopeptide (TPR) repeat protein